MRASNEINEGRYSVTIKCIPAWEANGQKALFSKRREVHVTTEQYNQSSDWLSK